MSFDIIANLNSYDSMLDNFILFAQASSTPWELTYQNSQGNSISFNTPSGAEPTTDRWAAFKRKTSINNAGTEDVKYSYLILQVDNGNNRLLARTASYVTSGGGTLNVTPFASSIKLDSVSFPFNIGMMFSADATGIMIKDSLNANKFAVVVPMDTVLTDSAQADNCFALVGSSDLAWVLPTSGYSAADLELNSYLVSNTTNSQVSAFILPPVAVHDAILYDKFVGYLKDAHKIYQNTIAAFDTITIGVSVYRIFANTADGVKFLAVKES